MTSPQTKTQLKTTPFWTDDISSPAVLPEVDLPTEVDVVVVGGGYTGLNAARVLAKDGASVAVLEQNCVGWGASSRNGGIAITGLKQSLPAIFKKYGAHAAREFWHISMDAIDLVGEVVADEGIACHFLRKGHLTLAAKPAHYEAMQEKADWFERILDHKLTLLHQSALRTEIGSDVFYGGLIDEWTASLHPGKYVHGLAEAVHRIGGVICEHTAVSRIKKENGRFKLYTSKGKVIADKVLVATNGYTDKLVPRLKARVLPVGSYTIVTEPLTPALQKRISPNGRTFTDSRRFVHYFRLTPDGRLLFGGRNNLSTNLDLLDSARRLYMHMVHIFPDLRNVPITHSWVGKLGMTFDLMPHIGQINGIHYAMGYGGQGVSLATYLGSEAGKLLCGQIKHSPFMNIHHPTRFFYRNRAWFLPFAAWWYRFLDWID